MSAVLPTHAIILAAGLGKRMRDVTKGKIPKPMVDVYGETLIDRALDFVARAHVPSVVVNTSYLAEKLEAHLALRNTPHTIVSREEEPLETGGGIRNALPMLGTKPFFSLNSDTICLHEKTHPLARLADAWDDTKMDALLLLHPREKAVGFDGAGDFEIASDGHVIRRGSAKTAAYVFTGVQLIHPRLFAHAPKQKAFSMNVLYDRDLSRVHALVHDGAWLHVGDAAGLHAAEDYLATH